MALNASKIPSGGNRKRQPALDAGAYPARLVQLIDLGLQPQQAWQGEEKMPKPEVYTTYELLDEFVVDDEGEEQEDKPRWASETLPMHSLDSDLAKSTKRYVALDPELEFGGAWPELMGVPCIVNLSADKDKKGKKDHNGDVIIYNNISSVQKMRAKDASKAPELKNPVKVFDGEDPDMEVFFSLPDWLRDKIKGALDFEGSTLSKALGKYNEKEEVEKRRKSRSDDQESKPSSKSKPEPEADDDNDEEDW